MKDQSDPAVAPQNTVPDTAAAPPNELPPTTTAAGTFATPMAPTSTFPPQPQPQPQQQYATQSPYSYSYPASNAYSSNPTDPYRMPYMVPPRYYEEDEGPGPFLQGVSLVALGGLVGLTAAAAVRWLNGGDFHLLPPPYNSDHAQPSNKVGLENRNGNGNGYYDNNNDDDDDDKVGDDRDHLEYTMDEDRDMDDHGLIPEQPEEKLWEQVQTISESFKTHVAIQEKILQKLSTSGSTITNQSMDLLRKANGVSTTNEESSSSTSSSNVLMIWSQLLDIKSQLIHLQDLQRHQQPPTTQSADEAKNEALQNQLSSTLSKLNACLDVIQQASCLSPPPVLPSSETPETPFITKKPFLEPVPDDTNSPTPTLSLRQAVRKIAEENDATTLRVGSQLLYLYIINLTGAPTNSRYRKIFTTNESFQKVECMRGGKDLLLAVGFVEQQPGCLEWLGSDPPSTEAEELAMVQLQQAAKALGILKSGKPSSELTLRALSVLSPEEPEENPPVVEAPVVPPSTPDESLLVSPPQPKKMPFVHLANDANTLHTEAQSTKARDMGNET